MRRLFALALMLAALPVLARAAEKGPCVQAAQPCTEWVALGDGFWKMDQLEKARATWAEGLKEYPETPGLQDRLSKQGDDLKTLIQDHFDFKKRVDTNLSNLWLYP